jgi:hypothetical protein
VVFVVLFSVFIAGRIYLIVDRADQLNESQNTIVFVYSVALNGGIFLLIAGWATLYGMRLNTRVRELSEREPDGVVLNVDKRHGTGLPEALLSLGVSKSEKASIFAVVANNQGLDVYSGHRPPKLVVHVPWQSVTSVKKGEFALGFRSIPRIDLTIRTPEGELELPLVPNQTGWGILNFSSRDRIMELVLLLIELRGRQTQQT